ncbi:ArsR family transcriptional regulator [Thermotomaculum hydrothermale]|uniref:ArsR family transcriptional regulator n=1 Tax=Thermotomaculum hydrothermale TaxID=981385 RepID=A0A7R6PG05_9BACT|nr:metalloregulator ArsR/SmtB family transcription factor [Thermotomaculum hydrothermale]BBB33048.1 ArsR family transcriptional regulator [Thermotomaculum hydrothermale]
MGSKKTKAEEMAKVMKALGHPSRALIVLELGDGPRCVCDLTELVGADISTVSKHLSILKKVGIVESEKKGLMVFYQLKSPCILNFYSCVHKVATNNKESHQIEKISSVNNVEDF